MGDSVSINTTVKNYTARVLGVVKEKYGLRDRGEAVDKLADLVGDEFVEKESSDAYVKKILKIEEEHFKKHGYRKMSDRELDELFGK